MDVTACTLERYGPGNRIGRRVQCIDTYGNLCRMQENIIDGGPELTIYAGIESPPGVEGELLGTLRCKSYNGEARFHDLHVSPPGIGYQIRFDALMPDAGGEGEVRESCLGRPTSIGGGV